MKQAKAIFLVLLLAALVGCQVVDLNQIFTIQTQATLGPEFKDPNFLKLIDNYFGCSQWKQGFCVKCSFGYIFNKNGVCCVIDQHCQVFNRDVGVCELCYTGYFIDANGTCIVHGPNDPLIVGCGKWKNNLCEACSAKHFFNTNKVCVAVSDHCREWNPVDGGCTSCYFGYKIDKGTCVLDPLAPGTVNVAENPRCNNWVDNKCEKCANRAFFDAKGICQFVADQCDTWDGKDGLCLSCYTGYDLISGGCVLSPSNTAAPADKGCKATNKGICLECSARWVFNAEGACITVNDMCRTHDNKGQCLTCFHGYDLVSGNCVYSPSNTAPPTDGGCAKWNLTAKVCDACSKNWVFDSNGLCVPVSTACQSHDAKGVCTDCYKGYELVSGGCVFSVTFNTASNVVGCKIWNWDTRICTNCSSFWVMDSKGVCVPVSDLCATHDAQGACLTCYRGFDLNNGVCVPAAVQAPADKGCRTWKGPVCEACSTSWVFNANKVCVEVSTQCLTHDLATGWCSSCYRGYDLTEVKDTNSKLVDITCSYSPSNTALPADRGCKTWENGVCTVCSGNWFFDAKKICQPVSDLCMSYDPVNGNCLSCFPGYDLVTGACVYSPKNTAAPSDKGCRTWQAGVCKACSQNWAFDANKICQQVSDSCKTSEGLLCTSCYNGFVLKAGVCEFSPFNSQAPSDAGCRDWDWDKQICKACSGYWFFNPSGKCVPVDPLCKSYDAGKGHCTGCWNGYTLNTVTGACDRAPDRAVSDAGCASWNWEANTCNACSPYWFKNSTVCTPVSPYCKSYDGANGACLTCFSGYEVKNGACVLSPFSLCKATGQDGCTACYDGFVLYKKECISLDKISNIALYYAECCPEKLAKLKADGRIPI